MLPRHPAARWSLLGLGGLLATLLLLFALIQTPPGKWAVARIVSSAASGDGLTVEISELGGLLPWRVTADKVVLRDSHGVFAQGENVRLKWHPFALIDGTVSVDDLRAAQIDFQRLPDLPPTPGKAKRKSSLPHMLVDRIAIDRIVLGEAVIGTPARLSLRAAVDNDGVVTRFDFDAQRRDAPGSIKGHASFDRASRSLTVAAVADEPEGGLLVRLLDVGGTPPLHAEIKGDGTLDHWDGVLTVAAGPDVRIDGTAAIRQGQAGHRATLDLHGTMARLLPTNLAPLFEGDTTIEAVLLADDKALVRVERFAAQSAGFGFTAKGSFDARGFSSDLAFRLEAKEPARFAGVLPQDVAFGALSLEGTIKGKPETPTIDARLAGQDITAAGYRLAKVDGMLTTAPSDDNTLTFTLDGTAHDLTSSGQDIGDVRLVASGTATAQRQIDITKLAVNGRAIDAQFEGHLNEDIVRGKLHVARFDLALLGPLAGQKLGGQLALDGNIDSSAERVVLDLDGRLDNFSSDQPRLDAMLAPRLSLNGGLTRGADGTLIARNLRAKSDAIDLVVDGRMDQALANLKMRATVSDMARIDPRLSGTATADIAFSGTLDKLNVQAALAMPQGKAMDQDVENLTLKFSAQDLRGQVSGSGTLSGTVGGKPANASASLATADDGSRQLSDLTVEIGSLTGKGALTQAPDGMVTGEVTLKAGNLADLTPLTLTALSGQLDATMKFDEQNGVQRVRVDGTATNLRAGEAVVGSGRIKLAVLDPLGLGPGGTPRLNGTAELANIRSGDLLFERATLTASNAGDTTDLHLVASGLGAAIDATGRLAAANGAPSLTLSAARVAKDGAVATLAQPATIVFEGGGARFDRLVLNTNGGSVVLSGSAGDKLNLTAELRGLPLSLLALAAPDIDASGSLSGRVKLAGSPAAPSGQYDLAIAKASTPRLQRAGLGPFDIKASGKVGGGRVTVDGTLSAPSLRGIAITGSVPLGKGEIDLAIKGQAGLNLINTALATTGTYASGNIAIDATIKGTADAPLAAGTIRIANGRFNDAINGIAIENIQAEIVAQGRDIAIRSFTARTGDEGTLQASGTISLDPQAGFPGNLQITAQKARLISNETVRLVADAKLALTGAFATTPRLVGSIDVRSMDVNIPDKLPGSLNATEVKHINVPNADKPKIETPQTKAQQRKAAERNRTARAAAPLVAALDLTIKAPARVFVRGRGMEAELGGTLRVTGTSEHPITNGSFDLRHGRLDVIDRRLTFTRGHVYFRGSTDPELDFAAESRSADITATVLVSGQASAPKIAFASTPSLPEDEILARLLFGKPASTLSPGQAIQVARAVAQFTGGGSNRRMDDLRRSLGISSLDIGTGENGGGQVGIGKRLNDNVYLGVSQGTTTNSGQVAVDIDLTNTIKLQGRAGAAGAEIGIGAEWDY